MSEEIDYNKLKPIIEVIELCKEDIENKEINEMGAFLNKRDLESLVFLYDLCKKEIDENIKLKNSK